MIRPVVAWLALMVLLLAELLATTAHAGWLAFGIAPVMVGLVAAVFMHAAQASALGRIFAVTGLFWVSILLCLGGVDFMARTNVPAPTLTQP